MSPQDAEPARGGGIHRLTTKNSLSTARASPEAHARVADAPTSLACAADRGPGQMSTSGQQPVATNLAMPSPMAEVIAFSQARRVNLVEKISARVAQAKSQEQGERLLAAAVRKQRGAMSRKRIPTHKIDRECRALENAIRTSVWRLILTPPTGDDAA
jgi:hypothetical protein